MRGYCTSPGAKCQTETRAKSAAGGQHLTKPWPCLRVHPCEGTLASHCAANRAPLPPQTLAEQRTCARMILGR